MFFYFVFLLVGAAQAELQSVATPLHPDPTTVYKFDGYVRARGFVDLMNLTFSVDDFNSAFEDDDIMAETDDDDEFSEGDDLGDDDEVDGDDSPGGLRRLDDEETEIDVLVFKLPDDCANSRSGCDLVDLGIGAKAKNDKGEMETFYCCTNEAADKGLCQQRDNSINRLIINKSVDGGYTGHTSFVGIPRSGEVETSIKKAKYRIDETGHYVVAIANCNPGGRDVLMKGNIVWKSHYGYLPGELFGVMRFYMLLMFIYLLMFLWYCGSMLMNASSRIPIEKWVLLTIGLALTQLTCRFIDFMIWNETGVHKLFFALLPILFDCLKNGLARCLAVMVGLGWGVVRDSLGSSLRTIIILGFAYMAISVAIELLIVFAYEDADVLSTKQEESVFDIAFVLNFILASLDVIFFMWMLDALNNTMEYLEEMSQSRKLQRYLRLRTLLMFIMLGAVFWAIFSIVDTYDETGILLEENKWVTFALEESIFCAALLGVAVLWRPNPNAKEYAYVMELPAMGGEDGENELELTGVVPSAMDDDDDDMESPSGRRNGYHDDNRFTDAEIS